MSRNGAVAFEWADGHYSFRLGLGDIRELQEKCDAGPAFIMGRLIDGSWRVDDIYQTIRLGLIGGGLTPVKALAVCQKYVAGRPLLENILAAQLILQSALAGVEDEPLGKTQVAGDPANPTSQEASSASPPSTE